MRCEGEWNLVHPSTAASALQLKTQDEPKVIKKFFLKLESAHVTTARQQGSADLQRKEVWVLQSCFKSNVPLWKSLQVLSANLSAASAEECDQPWGKICSLVSLFLEIIYLGFVKSMLFLRVILWMNMGIVIWLQIA